MTTPSTSPSLPSPASAADASTRPPAAKRPAHHGRVARVSRRSEHVVRVVVGGLEGFVPSPHSDSYVRLELPGQPETTTRRAYTVRAVGTGTDGHPEVTLDIVLHHDGAGEVAGLVARWASTTLPGDSVTLHGPGGAWSPAVDADWHLLVGDASAAPAIAAGVANLPAGAKAVVVIEPPADADRGHFGDDLTAPAGTEVDVVWVDPSEAAPGSGLAGAVRALPWREGRVDAFVHGEAGAVRDLRAYLRVERGLPTSDLSISGYWRYGAVDEEWRRSKKAWLAEIEAAEAAAGVA